MKPFYKVWVSVEFIDPDNDVYKELDSPFGAAASFDTEAEAQRFAEQLQDVGVELSGE